MGEVSSDADAAPASQDGPGRATDLSLAIIEWGPDFKVRGWNDQAGQILGWTAEEAAGRTPDDLRFLPEDGLAFSLSLARLLEGVEQSTVGYHRSQRKDGSTVRCEWFNSVQTDQDGRVMSVFSRVYDISSHNSIEQALRESESRFKAMFDQAAVGIAHIGIDGRVVMGNDKLCEIIGDSREELACVDLMSLTHPDDRGADSRALFQILAGEMGSIALEKRFLRKTGPPVWVEQTISLVRRDNGWPDYFIAVIQDATRRRAAEEERDRLLAREQDARRLAEEIAEVRTAELAETRGKLVHTEKLAAVGQLAAGVGHEINNPLAFVSANLKFISEELTEMSAAADDTRVAELLMALDEAMAGAHRIRDIVRDLKTFARANEDRVGPVDLAGIVDSSVSMAMNQLKHRAQVVKDYRAIPRVRGNESRLGQVFLNLLVNAAQAIPEGASARNEIAVRLFPEEGRVVLEVSDTGTGIPPEVLPRIFEPFFTTKKQGEGTGLGLSICHGIVTGFGGEITVKSVPGKGTTFRVSFPAVEESHEEEASVAVAQPPRARAPRRGRVLVVDDEPSIAGALRRTLGREHDVVVATSGRAALDLLAGDDRFDVIFCDLMMPEVTGMDVYAHLRDSRPGLCDRIVLMTGGAFTPRASAFLEAVRAPRIDKPFDADAVRELVASRLGEPSRPVG
jgi:PAS domain S-box-containing protein